MRGQKIHKIPILFTGGLSGLVVGQLGECSQDLHDLLLRFAEERAANLGRAQGIPLSNNQQALILQQFRRRLSVCAIRAQSACLLSSLSHYGESAHQSAQRRALYISRDEASRRDLRVHFEAQVRSPRHRHVGLLHI